MTRHQAGLAMIDALIALLLLGIALTGAGVTLVQTMRSTQGALLAGTAIDLASDLREQLRLAATPEAVRGTVRDWQARVANLLPVSGIDEGPATVVPAAGPDRIDVLLRWRGDSAGEVQELRVPIVADHDVVTALSDAAP